MKIKIFDIPELTVEPFFPSSFYKLRNLLFKSRLSISLLLAAKSKSTDRGLFPVLHDLR